MEKKTSQPLDIMHKVHKLMCIMDKVLDSSLRETLDLSVSQFRILFAIQHYQMKISQTHIAKFHNLTQAAVSRQVKRLINLGLITRKSRPTSKRAYMLSLTKRGQERYAEAMGIIEKRCQKYFTHLPSSDQKLINQSLQNILQTINIFE